MLSEKEIIDIKNSHTDRPISKDAVSYLIEGYEKFNSQRYNINFQMSEQGVKSIIENLFVRIEKSNEEITKMEFEKICVFLPYPFNLWFC